MPRSILRDEYALLIAQGGVEIPEVRDDDYSVTLIMRAGNKVSTGMHWHEKKTEYLQVLQGCARVYVGGVTKSVYPGDGIVTIPPLTLHEFGRADEYVADPSYRDVDLRIREWTSPPDGAKQTFFRNILGIMLDQPKDAGPLDNVKVLLALFVVMDEHDSYPVLWEGPRFLGEAIQERVRKRTTYLVQGALALIGRLYGLKGTYEESTPE